MHLLELYPWLLPSLIAFLMVAVGLELWNRCQLYRFRPLPSVTIGNHSTLPVSVVLLCEPTSTPDAAMTTLEAVASQKYVEVEVHVLAFCPDTVLQNRVEGYAERSPYPIRYTLLPQTMKNIVHRKMAITIGTKSARHEAIVLTQAGAKPHTTYWLYKMALAATQQGVYSAPIFLYKDHTANGTVHYLYTLLALTTQRQSNTRRMATEANFAYAKTMFTKNTMVFSKALDGEGGEALSIARTLEHVEPLECSEDVIVYIEGKPSAITKTLQDILRTIEAGYPELLRPYKWSSLLMKFIWLVTFVYIGLRLSSETSYSSELLLCDILVGLSLFVEFLTHTISFSQLKRSLNLGGSSALAYWHALWLSAYIYYYKLLYQSSKKG